MNTVARVGRGRRVALAVVLAGVCVGTAACSPAYSVSGQLAQAASDASAQAQTAALTLAWSADQRLPSPASETALSDAVQKLGQDDSTLTSTVVSGSLEISRRRILSEVRTGEDLLVRAQKLTSAGAGTAASTSVVHQLEANSKQLSALQKQLQGSG